MTWIAKMKKLTNLLSEMPTLIKDYTKEKNEIKTGKSYRKRIPDYDPKIANKNKKRLSPFLRTSKERRNVFLRNDRARITQSSSKKISETDSGHHILASKIRKDGYTDRKFSAYNPKTKKIDMKVTGNFDHETKKFKVDFLSGRPGSTLKAHDFYHHLLDKGHVSELHSSDAQSPGGASVWKKLSEHPGVSMTHHEPEIKHTYTGKLVQHPERNEAPHKGADWSKHYADEKTPSSSPKFNSFFIAKKKSITEQVLSEMPRLIQNYSKEFNKLEDSHYSNNEDHGKHVSTTNTGHRIHFKATSGGTGSEIKAINKKTGKVDVHIIGNHHRPSNTFQIGSVRAAEGSKLKAHDLYAHLATKWRMAVASSSGQSPGGMKIWQKLSKHPKVDMIKVSSLADKKKVPIKKNWRHNYTIDSNKPEAKSIFVIQAKKK